MVKGTNRKSITGSSLFVKSNVKRIIPSFASKDSSVCVPSGAMRTSFLPSSSPVDSAMLTRPMGCVRLPAGIRPIFEDTVSTFLTRKVSFCFRYGFFYQFQFWNMK